MTNKEAIDLLDNLIGMIEDNHNSDYDTALRMGVKALKQEQWKELKETIIELRDNNGTGRQQEVCKFLVNYMNVLEKQMQAESEVSNEKEI